MTLSGVPVLAYHALIEARVPHMSLRRQRYAVTSLRFRAQLEHIRNRGYQARLLDDLWSSPATPDRPGQPVVLTFDDGNVSDVRLALPLLARYGVRAEFFVNTANIGTTGYIDWHDVRRMHDAGMSFQSHSHEHVDLTQLPPHGLQRQIGDSKRMLEDRLGTPVTFLAPPYGRFNARVIEGAREIGYRAIVTSWNWPAQVGALTVDRVTVYRHTTLVEFKRLLALDLVSYATRAARDGLLSWGRRLVSAKRLFLRRRPAPPSSSIGQKVA